MLWFMASLKFGCGANVSTSGARGLHVTTWLFIPLWWLHPVGHSVFLYITAGTIGKAPVNQGEYRAGAQLAHHT
jgi:hypothetical protein